MPIRTTLVILALISLLAVGGGGLFVTNQLTQTAWDVAYRHAEMTASMINQEIDFFLRHQQQNASTLANLPQTSALFSPLDNTKQAAMNRLLKRFCDSEAASQCYIMDAEGTTVASSNHNSATSFVGKNYGFRPYFKEAIKGKTSVYFALGVTTRSRGAYFSAPISDDSGTIVGVAVMKFPLEELEQEYANLPGIFALVDSNGVVFASNQADWLFKSLFDLSTEKARAIKQSRQFGETPPQSIGLTAQPDRLLGDQNGVRYLFGAPKLKHLPQWETYYLIDSEHISKWLTHTQFDNLRLAFGILFLVIVATVLFLYQRATAEIERRRRVEQTLRNSEEKYRLLFEKSEDPMWIIYDSVFMQANHAAALTLGYDGVEELTNIHPGRISPHQQPDGSESISKANKMMSLAYDKGFHRFEWEFKRRNGEVFPVEVSLTRIPHLGRNALYCVWRDISESKQAQHSLEMAIVEAQRANRAKSEFLSAMSHEIRTPMTGVMGFADILLDDDLPAESHDKVLRIKRSTQALLRLLNDILDMSKLEAGKLEIEAIDFDLKALIDDVCSLFERNRQGDKNVDLIIDFDASVADCVRTDPTRLRQILVNLVGNALKFTHEGEVRIEVRLQQDEASPMLHFGVHDTGIGISAEAMRNLFREFTQADASISRRYEGSGLGLAISKRLVELLGGQIEAHSVEGQGSHFCFDLPYIPASKKSSDSLSQKTGTLSYRGQQALRILVAEDNRVNQMIIRRFMQDYGHSVTVVENGEEVLQALSGATFDLILMDVRMPVMDGLEATRRIRAATQAWQSIPVIAVTADAMKEHQQEFIDSGMNAYVAKPFDRSELAITINDVMQSEIHVEVDTSNN